MASRPHPRAGVHPWLVAVVPVMVLAVLGAAAVLAARPEDQVLALGGLAAGTAVALAAGLALAGSLRRRLDELAAAALGAHAALDEAARAVAEGRAVEGAEDRRDVRYPLEPVAASSGAAPVGDHDAIAVTTAALDRLVGTAAHLLAEEGRRRRGTAELFVNVGRRNQNLVGRQLELLDRLEETETDPDTLASLFRLDHLSTRMRRNAESLLVVAGLELPQRWRRPVPVREVARAAAAESEQFERVELGTFPIVALGGDTVATVVHLLAELIDNAVRFSPPGTSVAVAAAPDDDDLVITVTDTGVGMAATAVEQANAQLDAAARRDADVPTAELGLYVVGRLAARLGVEVRLDSAAGDGVTASVRIPAALLEAAPTSAVESPPPSDARRTVAAAERAANGSVGARRGKGGAARRTANGSHRVEARGAGSARSRAGRDDDRPAAESTASSEAARAERDGVTVNEQTASGFRRRQPKAAAAGAEPERRTSSRLRAPDPTSAEERRARLDRFSAGKASAEEVVMLGNADDRATDATSDDGAD